MSQANSFKILISQFAGIPRSFEGEQANVADLPTGRKADLLKLGSR
jgi:hypothetical protein